MSNKIGFWSVFELVTISQIGSGLMLPANLSPYGSLTLVGWVISSLGALILALVFCQLCKWYPRTGGLHVYVREAFGRSASFFTGWTYWVISWVSTIAIVISVVGYLTPLIGARSSSFNLAFEISIVLMITAINLKGVETAAKARFFVILLKMIPLILVPLGALFFFDKGNFTPANPIAPEYSCHLNNVILLTLWGFIGFESATAAAGEVINPAKTIPRALILGTLFVAVIYFVSSLGIMGIIPGHELMHSNAPYTDAASVLFGGSWHLIVSLIAAVICIGAVNAWTLASGQIALGIAQDGLLPKFFARQNKHGAPVYALLISCAGTIPLLVMAKDASMVDKVHTIIDFSVTAFLFVYVVSCLAYLKLLRQQPGKVILWKWICGLVSLGFCGWVIYETPAKILLCASLFVLSGLPIYLLRNTKHNQAVDTVLPAATA